MSIIQEALDRLESQGFGAQSSTASGTRLFGEYLPDAPDSAIGVFRDTAGPTIRKSGGGQNSVVFQEEILLFRLRGPSTGLPELENLTQAVEIAWESASPWSTTSAAPSHYKRSWIVGTPRTGTDARDRWVHDLRVQVWRKPSTSTG